MLIDRLHETFSALPPKLDFIRRQTKRGSRLLDVDPDILNR
jgi:hypothetical protein